jgi:hypothetical protein
VDFRLDYFDLRFRASPRFFGSRFQVKTHFFFFFGGGGLYTARARAHPPPPPRLGRAPGSDEPGGPRRRKQSRGPHRSRRQPTPLPGLRCGTRLARRASPHAFFGRMGLFSFKYSILNIESMRQLAWEAPAAPAPAHPRAPGGRLAMHRDVRMPPGCTPRLPWGSMVDTKFDSSNHGLC